MQHHIVVKKSKDTVYLIIDDETFEMQPFLSREVGDALYKAGCDTEQGAKSE